MNILIPFLVFVGVVGSGTAVSAFVWHRRVTLVDEGLPHRDARSYPADLEECTRMVSIAVGAQQGLLQSHQSALMRAVVDGPSDLLELVSDRIGQLFQANLDLKTQVVQAKSQIEEQQNVVENSIRESHLDALTGVANRRGLERMLTSARESTDNGAPQMLFVMIADVDHFKQLNDCLGHAAGDLALQAIAKALERSVPERAVARYGGEEFAAIVKVRSVHQLSMVVRDMLQAVRKTWFVTTYHPLSISVGAARWEARESSEAVMERADQALYAAKHHGRDQGFLHEADRMVPIWPQGAPLVQVQEDPMKNPRERRRHRRRIYRHSAQIAFGSPSDLDPQPFRKVECINISQSGLVFHMDFPPSCDTMIVKINELQTPFLLYSEQRSSTPLVDGRWRVSCEFIRRIDERATDDYVADNPE